MIRCGDVVEMLLRPKTNEARPVMQPELLRGNEYERKSILPRKKIYEDAARDLEIESRLEMRGLSDLAWIFLLATNNDTGAAVKLMARSLS
jgi:hypothetical protein